jgi:hypothetical protein
MPQQYNVTGIRAHKHQADPSDVSCAALLLGNWNHTRSYLIIRALKEKSSFSKLNHCAARNSLSICQRICRVIHLYRVIQSSNTIRKKDVGEIIWCRKCT